MLDSPCTCSDEIVVLCLWLHLSRHLWYRGGDSSVGSSGQCVGGKGHWRRPVTKRREAERGEVGMSGRGKGG